MPDELKITAKAVYDELVARQIAVEVFETRPGTLKFHDGTTSRYVQGSLTDRSSPIGKNISDKKLLSAKVAAALGVLQPMSQIYTDIESAKLFLDTYSPIVLKPNDGSHGEGVTIDLIDQPELEAAIEVALVSSKTNKALMQQQVSGFDVRVLMINNELAASAVRTPATIVGDGVHTIGQLIETENINPLRGENYARQLNIIDVTAAKEYLGEKYTSVVPENSESVQVVGTANIGTGGTATDITDQLPVAIINQSRRLMQELGQDCCGVDFIAADIDDAASYYFIEVNSAPSFGLHLKPTIGRPREVQKQYVDMLLGRSK